MSRRLSQKNSQKSNQKTNRVIAISVLLMLLLSGTVLYLVFNQGEDIEEIHIIGMAEAVSITAGTYRDGLGDSHGIFDELYSPIGLALLGTHLVVADSMCDRIQILDGGANERIGMPGRFGLSYQESGAFIDGFREYAMFMKPAGVFATPTGDIVVADTGNHAIRLITGAFVITIAGNGFPGYRDGAETSAQFNGPRAAVMCHNGYIYVADTLNHVIRRIDPDGNVGLYAGSPMESGFVDGHQTNARFFQPSGLYLTQDGVLYVADAANHAIRRIENGEVTTVAGRPGEPIAFSQYFYGGHVDGLNADAMFDFPRDIALLPNGDILVADSQNHAIRLITSTETRTILGSGAAGRFHYSAENMQLTRPEGIVTDGHLVYISDTLNNRVVSVPLTPRVLAGRPSRNQMLADSGLSINSRFAFRGDIRVFLGDQRVDMGRVQPWLRGDSIFVPIRPLLEGLGAGVQLNEVTNELSIFVGDTVTILTRDVDYFIMRGIMVTTLEELTRLFPYTIEWFPELSLITLYIPQDLRGA